MKELIEGLQKREAYTHRTADITRMIQTATACIFLTGDLAYKINKPIDIGFVDFTTLDKRKKQCENEYRYNKVLAPELYLGVSKVCQSHNGVIVVDPPDDLPIIEYAVRMKQMKPDAIMTRLLLDGKIAGEHIRNVAMQIALFHRKCEQNAEVNFYGMPEMIKYNWDENFEQTKNCIGTLISQAEFDFVRKKINEFQARSKDFFEHRVNNNRVRHCHGDLHTGNIFVDDKVTIFDGITFNLRFPCCDVASEVAFLAMDFDSLGRSDFADLFITSYVMFSGDREIKRLMQFYKCYRAWIRAKILSFQLNEPNTPLMEKPRVREKAQKYFRFAVDYAKLL
ncbi:phosphotransferase [Candidatus Woesearchaeota archaeon]|nr:phosphotransferase [Candidatus Woesearchaeota archaeon]